MKAEKLRDRAAPHLPPGETYRASFGAAKGILPGLFYAWRVVVVTDVRVHVFAAGWWRVGQPRRLIASLPPGTVLVPSQVPFYEVLDLAGEQLYVTFAWRKELRAAIAASYETYQRMVQVAAGAPVGPSAPVGHSGPT